MHAIRNILISATAILASYPLFKQCDPKWGNNEMGVNGNGERSTICGEGCAMTSVSMVLAGLGYNIDPGTFNTWLMNNNGYLCLDGDCNNLNVTKPSEYSGKISLIGELPKPSKASIQQGIATNTIAYIAHIPSLVHFVLLTGYESASSDVFYVNDAFYNATSYLYSNISDIFMYNLAMDEPSEKDASSSSSSSSSLNLDVQIAPTPVIPFNYPLFSQCDPAWAKDVIGNETVTTICDVGCLMSSVSMVLAFNNITIPSLCGFSQMSTANPQSLNFWLVNHYGYVDGDDFDEGDLPALAPSKIGWSETYGMHVKNDVPISVIQQLITSGQPVIANVMAGRHFVLVTGWDSNNFDTLYVNDPGFSTQTYSYSNDVVGWRLFNITL
jgi:Peptidase_C39 like family